MKKGYYLPIIIMALFLQPLYAQTCRNDITPTTPTRDFTIHNDGTVTHRKTGLMWMRCALGQNWNGADCAGDAQWHNWQGALQAADGSSFAGHSDWRLPNIKELNSIVERACMDPAINTTVYLGPEPALYWSASTYASLVSNAWFVYFSAGYDYHYDKTNYLLVRLVRGGQ